MKEKSFSKWATTHQKYLHEMYDILSKYKNIKKPLFLSFAYFMFENSSGFTTGYE